MSHQYATSCQRILKHYREQSRPVNQVLKTSCPCQGFLVQAGLAGCCTTHAEDTTPPKVTQLLEGHMDYIACTSPCVQPKRVRTNRAGSLTRCYTFSICIQFPLPSVLVCKSTQLICLQSCLDATATQLLAGRILIRFHMCNLPWDALENTRAHHLNHQR